MKTSFAYVAAALLPAVFAADFSAANADSKKIGPAVEHMIPKIQAQCTDLPVNCQNDLMMLLNGLAAGALDHNMINTAELQFTAAIQQRPQCDGPIKSCMKKIEDKPVPTLPAPAAPASKESK